MAPPASATPPTAVDEPGAAESSVVERSLDRTSGRMGTRGCSVSTRCGSKETLKSVAVLIVACVELNVGSGVELGDEKAKFKRRATERN